jgi:hypothetical protein
MPWQATARIHEAMLEQSSYTLFCTSQSVKFRVFSVPVLLRSWFINEQERAHGKRYMAEQIELAAAESKSRLRMGRRSRWRTGKTASPSKRTTADAKEYGRLHMDQAQRLKELEQENVKLKWLVENRPVNTDVSHSLLFSPIAAEETKIAQFPGGIWAMLIFKYSISITYD